MKIGKLTGAMLVAAGIAATPLLLAPSAISSTADASTTPAAATPSAVDTLAQPMRRSSVRQAAGAGEANCPVVRRKLWVDEEGWVVRRVPLCG